MYRGQFDNEHELLGRPAGPGDVRAVTALVGRYYAAAASGDGAEGCRLLYTPLAESVAPNYGGVAGPPALRGKTCGVVLSKMFRQQQARLRADRATLRVRAVRVVGNRGSVRLAFQGRSAPHSLLLHRERGRWKVDTLLDIEQLILVG